MFFFFNKAMIKSLSLLEQNKTFLWNFTAVSFEALLKSKTGVKKNNKKNNWKGWNEAKGRNETVFHSLKEVTYIFCG